MTDRYPVKETEKQILQTHPQESFFMTAALAGIRVLDFGRYIAGPYCATLLADLGAEVIRIERREGGEDRYLVPVTEQGEGAMFIGLNRNKKGITLDPAHPQSAEIKHRLIASADVVVANLPINILTKLELDYDALTAIKPDIILTMVSAFGATGPYANRVGFDSVVQAMSGAMSLTGFAPTPTRAMVAFEDFATALHAAFGTMVALFERQRSGRGQMVEGSLLSTGILMMASLLAERHVTGIVREQRGNASFHTAPADAFQTKDGWLMVQVISNPIFARWAKLVGRADFIDDPRFADDLARGDHYEIINEAMIAWAKQRTTAEAITELEAARVPCGPVHDLASTLNDPQIQARELLQYLDYPGSPKPIPVPAQPVQLSATPAAIRHRAPTLGEHTDEILVSLGFSLDEIAAFRLAHVI
jgi:crotonobetainyl-CoA:carnitine CoA-transferase CaiB-like acyl-CoA transferase